MKRRRVKEVLAMLAMSSGVATGCAGRGGDDGAGGGHRYTEYCSEDRFTGEHCEEIYDPYVDPAEEDDVTPRPILGRR
jgi:hypothetical protein